MTVELESFGATRELNRLRVVDALRRAGTASRSDLARATGLSRTTVASLVADLHDRGLIVEQANDRPQPAGRGRPPVLLRLDAAAGSALGIDFGHRHVRVAVADLASTVLEERFLELDVDDAPEESLDTAAELVMDVLADAGVDRSRVIGAGMALAAPDRQAQRRARLDRPSRLGRNPGRRGALAPARDPRRARQRRQPWGAGRSLVRRRKRLRRCRLRDDLGRHRRWARARRPPLPRRLGHGRRARTHPDPGGRRRVPLRKPRLPGDGGGHRPAPLAPPSHARRAISRSTAFWSSSPTATSRPDASSTTRDWRSDGPSPTSATT